MIFILRGHIRTTFDDTRLLEFMKQVVERNQSSISIYIHTWSIKQSSLSWREISAIEEPVTPALIYEYFQEIKQHIKHIIIDDDRHITLEGKLDGFVCSTKMPTRAWKNYWYGQAHIMKYIYARTQDKQTKIINCRFDIFNNPFSSSKEDLLSFIQTQPNCNFISLMKKYYGIDNIMIGTARSMYFLAHHFNSNLDYIVKKYPSLESQEQLVPYENKPHNLDGLEKATIYNDMYMTSIQEKHPVNIFNSNSNSQYLSCPQDCNFVDFYRVDDNSGRQKWIIEIVDSIVYIKLVYTREDNAMYLGKHENSVNLLLYPTKNKYTRWTLEQEDINRYRLSYNYFSYQLQSQLLTSVLYDVIVVGAGLSGAVLAERFANAGKRVLVVEKRDHIAGNCYDYLNKDGHLINKYGLHIFHCNDPKIYNYITHFSEWIRYDHKVVSRVGGHLVPVPVNIETVNVLCNETIQTSEEMDEWLQQNQVHCDNSEIVNSEQVAKARVGEKLYGLLFENYTKKQWNKSPAELDRSVLERIPVRRNHDTRYFSDKYQVLPLHGYTKFVESILDHPLITVKLNVDFEAVRHQFQYKHKEWLIYTGPIDRYFSNHGLDKLEYRSIIFDEQHLENVGFFQERVVVNDPSPDVKFTRCVEYKHLPQNSIVKTANTTIIYEYTTDGGDPYYPVPNERNKQLYEKYREIAEKEEENGVVFIGRLANYKYKDMHVAISDALDLFNKLAKSTRSDLSAIQEISDLSDNLFVSVEKPTFVVDVIHKLYMKDDSHLFNCTDIFIDKETLLSTNPFTKNAQKTKYDEDNDRHKWYIERITIFGVTSEVVRIRIGSGRNDNLVYLGKHETNDGIVLHQYQNAFTQWFIRESTNPEYKYELIYHH